MTSADLDVIMRTIVADLGHDSLKPLTYTRSSTDLEVGGQTVFEHIEDGLEEDVDVLVPEHLEEVTEMNSELYNLEREVNPEIDGSVLLYNSTVIPNDEIRRELGNLQSGEGLYHQENFIAGVTDDLEDFEDLEETISSMDRTEVSEEPAILEYPWDMVEHNGELIEQAFPGGEIKGMLSEEATVLGDREQVYLGEEAEIAANATIDTSEGPVYIGSGTKVWPNSRIEGPAYIGSDTKVGAGQNAVIHENTHVGDVARVGGELEDAIMNSFSNKYHYGFLGHAVVGSWVNFGAGTTNSDLKNTYGTVKVDHPEEGEVEAGLKVGATIADHTKTDIETGIYTGKQIGPVAKIADTVTDDARPFTWQNPGEEADYDPERATEHAGRMMDRREEHLPEGYAEAQKNLIRELSDNLR